jgi:DNA-binding MarR family transcriptional regulator
MELQRSVCFAEPPIAVNQHPAYYKIVNLHQTYSVVDAAFDAALSPFGLSSAQWDVLRLLREHPGASGADVARCAKVTPQAVATMLQRLEKAGLITRHSARGRVVETYLTQQGESLLKKGDRIAEQIEAQVFSGFSAEEQEQFNQYLLRCRANLNSDEYRQEQ